MFVYKLSGCGFESRWWTNYVIAHHKKQCLILNYFLKTLMGIRFLSYCFWLIGALVTVNCFMLEYIGIRWRTITTCFPTWGIGIMLFGALFKVLPNWRHLCIAAAVVGLPTSILLLWVKIAILDFKILYKIYKRLFEFVRECILVKNQVCHQQL